MINTVLTMKSKAIKVGVCSGRQQLAEFKEAWKRAERGLPPKGPVDRLYFPDANTMFRALSRSRVRILLVLGNVAGLACWRSPRRWVVTIRTCMRT